MDAVTEATAVQGKGLAGDVTTSRRRQVTIIELEAWVQMMSELGAAASPAGRRANLMVSGIPLRQTRGRILRIGGVRFAIGGETTPCERMDEFLPGLRDAMRPGWRGGVFAQVLDDGRLAVGDASVLEPGSPDVRGGVET